LEKEYLIGVMATPVENPDEHFQIVVTEAVKQAETILVDNLPHLALDIFQFFGPHLNPVNGSYSPLELLRLGVIEKVERKPNFLIVITEVEIAAHLTTYSVALPSPLTNVSVLSLKRLNPVFWGMDENNTVIINRLVGLLLQTIGHLLNLPSHDSPQNIMYRFEELSALESMREITDEQIKRMKRGLPSEARDLTARTPAYGFVWQRILANGSSIWRTVVRSNPFSLALQMTTMIAAAVSLMVVIFFSTEMWDIGSTVELYQFMIFALLCVGIATLVIYRAYPLRTVSTHTRRVSESLVVTNAATFFTLFLTMWVLYAGFWLLIYFGILTLFPDTLMETWPTVDPATRTLDHIKISTFIAAMGILVGSLGGRADNEELMRRILFINEKV